ncbi:GNAT family N-acetyltransferase [Citroniella saccharovorans]|uniref:GNAT family N-acetyltransferase n=1 Tax=Citroniella saccharovorans TaxID=2053367 RepID=A0AAW9MTI8_9FIRM|nr:GNAT family N-acetyltransferase [Citroniella saccharovorans]MEB3429325.1 GNAT family N-acetyltransferase [Citroniella saccharovorans]
MIKTYIPKYEDLWFRKLILSDPETMSYNKAWGGIIDFPESKWDRWYKNWIIDTAGKRYYRYLTDENNKFVGEIAYYFEENKKIYLASIIIFSKYRGKGYGRSGLKLLCQKAKNNGLRELYDDLATNNSAIKLFTELGFKEEYRNKDIIMLKKIL